MKKKQVIIDQLDFSDVTFLEDVKRFAADKFPAATQFSKRRRSD